MKRKILRLKIVSHNPGKYLSRKRTKKIKRMYFVFLVMIFFLNCLKDYDENQWKFPIPENSTSACASQPALAIRKDINWPRQHNLMNDVSSPSFVPKYMDFLYLMEFSVRLPLLSIKDAETSDS